MNTGSALRAVSMLVSPDIDAEGVIDDKLSAVSRARSSSLDPIKTCSPARASRTASPLPSGPVPPMKPITDGGEEVSKTAATLAEV